MKEILLPEAGTAAASPRLLVVGDVMLDRVLQGEAARLSPEAPVPIIHQNATREQPGGAANVAANLAALGAEVRLLGVCGRDHDGHRLQNLLHEQGVIRSDLLEMPDAPTTTKTRIVARNQQIARLDVEKTAALPTGIETRLIALLREELADYAAVLVPDYGKGVVTPNLWAELRTLCGKASIPLLVDPSPRAAMTDYRHATVVKPNWLEAQRAACQHGEDNLTVEQVGQRWLDESAAAAVLITRGEMGMSLFRREHHRVDVPGLHRDVFDVTGAGDSVLAALGWAMAAGIPVDEAVILANLAGGLAVERFGTASIGRTDLERGLKPEAGLEKKMIDRADLNRFLLSHRQKGHKVVFTNGCFDILHPGHLRLLRRSAACGDVVIVGLNSDASVRRLKGPQRPVMKESDRAMMLAALPDVDAVVVFGEDTPANLIELVMPDVLVKGGDYRPDQVVGREVVEARGGRLELIPLRPGISTSSLVDRMERRSHESGTVDGGNDAK